MILPWLIAMLIVVGSLFSLLAAVGILRMPDFYMRVQAAAKSSTLGVSFIALAAALALIPSAGVPARAMLIVAFLLLTAPVAAHMICRAAYAAHVPLWQGTIVDELQEHQQAASPDSGT